ncbi:MAG: Glu-tRNA(Gln) amidotransferase subunit GatE [Candidatus Altiarchaeota archaeon]
MTIDYEKLNFKCGIEIHQQLDTHKLFCKCPSDIRDDEPDVIVMRKMRAVAGELGDIDPAALYEFLRNKEIIYEAYSSSNCLVELDEEPPHALNEEALDIAIEISLLLNAKIIPELHVMRKTVIDGSNTSGFQRTLLIAIDGFLETSYGKVKIPTICLEEDSARKVIEQDGRVVYRLDRLGIPLIEICTNSEIKTAEHAREVAEKIGAILRATGKVKRGLGTIRQDLNISILNSERVEIKGIQDLRLITKVIENEILRQLMLIEIKNELLKRKFKKEILKDEFVDVTEIFRNTNSKIIRNFINANGVVLALKLPCFSGLLKGKFGPEIAQYARAYSNVKGIFHSDELPNYGISSNEVNAVREKLMLDNLDAFVLVSQEKEIAIKALKEVANRCRNAINGIIKETRKANDDGTTEFIRPLPGSERMYPETDENFIIIPEEKISRIKVNLPKLPAEQISEIIKIGIGRELALQLLKLSLTEKFKIFVEKYKKVKPSIIANTLVSTPKEIQRRYSAKVENLNDQHYNAIFKFLNEGKIAKEAIPEILIEFTKSPNKQIDEIIHEKNLGILSDEEIEKIIENAIRENLKKIQELGKDNAKEFIFGRVMSFIRGRANAEKIINLINEKFSKF